MHIGFFSSIVTDGRPTSGYELANEAIVEGLRSLGHTVRVIGFRLPRQQAAEGVVPLAVTNLENARASHFEKLRWIWKAHVTGLPIAAAKLTAWKPQDLEDAVSREGPFDAHIVNSWQIAAAFPALLDKPYGYVSHNVEHITAAENVDSASSEAMRYLYSREARLLKALETRICNNAAWVWALSEADLENLPESSGGGSVLPLVVPDDDRQSANVKKAADIGMIGTWTWQANTLGLQWFVDDVLPLLPEDMTIQVAGSVPADIAAKASRIDFLGRVDSARDFLDGVRVVALVSRGGTGVQLKTIEAFQAGLACAATSSALRGVTSIPENCRQADDAPLFAEALIDLVEMSRTGTLLNGMGKEFAEMQRAALLDSLNEGLTAIALQPSIN